MVRQLLSAVLVILLGITGRAITDKLLALRGGAEAVAAYAQLSSLTDLVSCVSLAGIGVALVAAVARAEPVRQFAWLRASLFPSLVLSGIAALVLLPFMSTVSGYVVPKGMEGQALLAVLVGWLVVATTLVMSFLIGTGRPGRAALWTIASFLPPLAALAINPFDAAPANVLLGQGVFGLLATIGIFLRQAEKIPWAEMRSLIRFAPAGIAIGILSPVSMLLVRTRIADVSGWDLVAQAQTVWRVNDWVQATAAGLLYIYFLPRLSAAVTSDAFWREMKRAAWTVVVPAGLVSAIIWVALPELAAMLYRPDMAPTRSDAALMLFGDWLRVVSWLFLYGLYARHAARAVTIGEFCSVPLFALLLWFSIRPESLVGVGAAWAVAYLVYAVFNGLALRETMAEQTKTSPQQAPSFPASAN
jgi:PST family polysaccharide transporter